MAETETADVIHAWASKLPVIFTRCVAREEGHKFDLTRPFVVGDHLYATDGRVGIRMPTPEGWDIPNPPKPPPLIAAFFEGDRWSAEPTVLPAVEGVCDECQGRGTLPARPCPKCGGRGRTSAGWCDCPECPGDHECEVCEGDGNAEAGPCRECDGSGVSDIWGRVTPRYGYWLSRKYVALLREHGATAYLPVAPDHGIPTRFTVGPVEGVLMPMTPPGPFEETP